MATWLIHLRVAEVIKSKIDIDNYEYFLIGNIAPDSGIANPDRLTYTPTAEISHFKSTQKKIWQNDDYLFYKTYLANNLFDKDKISFLLGYYCHLVVDSLWKGIVYRRIKNHHGINIENDKSYIEKIKNNWNSIDFQYLKDNQLWETWDIFQSSSLNENYVEWYDKNIINEKIKAIGTYYTKSIVGEKDNILTIKDINEFIELCGNIIPIVYRKSINYKCNEYNFSMLDIVEVEINKEISKFTNPILYRRSSS
jgi:hypothetical protein